MSKGTLIVDEDIYPITDIYLRNGIILIEAAVILTKTPARARSVRVHGDDGSLIHTIPDFVLELPIEANPGDGLLLQVGLEVAEEVTP